MGKTKRQPPDEHLKRAKAKGKNGNQGSFPPVQQRPLPSSGLHPHLSSGEIGVHGGVAVGEHDFDVMHGTFINGHDGERLPARFATGHGGLRRRDQRIPASASGTAVPEHQLHALRRNGLRGTAGSVHPHPLTVSTRLSPVMTSGWASPHRCSSVGAMSPSLPPERKGTALSPSAPRSTTTSGT